MGVISLDCETTGLDLFHGALPFLVTIGYEGGGQSWWEWDVDPYNRKPGIPITHLLEIQEEIDKADRILLQNPTFDSIALRKAFNHRGLEFHWNWSKVIDTLLAAHLINSLEQHDLTYIALMYARIDIDPYDKAVKEACRLARNWVRSNEPDWRIADSSLPEMPSAKGSKSLVKFDMWLPKLIAESEGWNEDDPWRTVTLDYARTDTDVLHPVWEVQEGILDDKHLLAIYHERLKLLPVIEDMILSGIGYNIDRAQNVWDNYFDKYNEHRDTCVGIASEFGYELTLPKSGNNNSLLEFAEAEDGLDLLLEDGASTSKKTGRIVLDKGSLEHFEMSVADEQKRQFISSLRKYRKLGKSLQDLDSYERYRIENPDLHEYGLIHPGINPTGSTTLRFSFSNPNSANVSKQKDDDGLTMRDMFGPLPEREWWALDAENIELRLPAYEAGEKEMIALFESPEEPPYYGSVHLLMFDTLHPQMFREHGADVKSVFKDTWYQWTKNGDFACVSMDTEALTRNGWKDYDSINVGDMVLGWEEGCLRWTEVLAKKKLINAPLVKLSNNKFSVRTTPDHRWWTRVRRTVGGVRQYVNEFCETSGLKTDHEIWLSAKADTPKALDITPDEAAIIGFAYGDGTIVKSDKSWGPARGALEDKTGFRVRLWQSKPEGVSFISSLLNRSGVIYKSREKKSGVKEWEIRPEDSRSIWSRSGLWNDLYALEKFVLRLDPQQRGAFLEAVWQAEGWLDFRGRRCYSQNIGPFAEAIKLAIFLEGHSARWSVGTKTELSRAENLQISEGLPRVACQRLSKVPDGHEDVWCIQTKLGTWVMRQEGHIMLTGNCQYGAVEESGTADRAYHVQGAQRRIKGRFQAIHGPGGLNERCIKFAEKYGYVETMPDLNVNPDRGYPLYCPTNRWGRVKPTVPLNYRVQGTAMWWMSKAMVRCHEYLETLNNFEGDKSYWIVLQVHDELVFDMPYADDFGNLPVAMELKRIMELGGDDIGVPTPVSVSYHPESWADEVEFSWSPFTPKHRG